MKRFVSRILMGLPLLLGLRAEAALSPATTIHLWRGTGKFSLVYEHAQYSQPCSFVLVQLIERADQVHLSTSYNCEDDEDQEFVPLTLERQGERLFYAHRFVGTLTNQILTLELKNGRQTERYLLDFRGTALQFQHLSDLGTPGVGLLQGELPRR